ncbi:MAG: High-affnity carbon uptake protein Hat/HatR, partial [Myxococcaceae bacterium]|nr:High-affnity carbon uptake protein Hat/HatR [Myxococcaceae bacterium]
PAHERIVPGWARLRAWLDARGERARREAVGVLRDWLGHQRGVLDRDPRLDGWCALLGGDDSPFNREEAELLRRSVALRADALRRAEEEVRRLQAALTRARDQTRMSAARGAAGDPTTQAVLLREVERPDATAGWAEMALAVLDERVAETVHAGHSDLVSTVAFSPDRRRVVTASFDGTARVWRVDGGGATVTLRAGRRAMTSAVFSPDSSLVLTASMDGTLLLWPADGGGAPRALIGHGEGEIVAAFSRGGGLVVSASHDRTARVWRVDTGQAVACLAHASEVESAGFSWDEALVVTGCRDGTASVWRVDGAGPLAVHRHGAADRASGLPGDGVVDVAFAAGDARVLSATRGEAPHGWRADGAGGTAVYGAGAPVEGRAFSPRGDRVLTVSGGVARLWGDDPLAPVAEFRAADEGVRAASFSADGTRVLIAGERTTRIWQVDPPGEPTVLRVPDVTLAALSPDGALAVTVTGNRAAQLWRLGEQGRPQVWRGAGIVDAAIQADRLRVVTSSAGGHVVGLWRAGDAAPTTFAGHAGNVRSARFSRAGERLLTASDDKTATIWQLDGSKPPVALRGHEGPVHLAEFSPSERHVLTASADGTVRLWDASTGHEAACLSHGAPVFTARFSPGGDRVFSVAGAVAYAWSLRPPPRAPRVTPLRRSFMASVAISPDGLHIAAATGRIARIWRRDGKGEGPSLAHAEDVDLVAFSPDGRWLATASQDAVVRVWGVADGALRVELRGHEHWLTSLAFSPDGARLATTSYDATARAWLIDPAALLDALRAATTHELPSAERVERLGESEPEARAQRASLLARRRRSRAPKSPRRPPETHPP